MSDRINNENAQEGVVWLYSYDAAGWFSPKYNTEIPADAVEVSEARMIELKEGAGTGQVLVKGVDGLPVLADPPPPTDEALAERERRWRDMQLATTDPLVTRHRDELELEQTTTLTASQYQVLQLYRVALRSWPAAMDFPAPAERPEPPAWLLDTTL